MPELTGLGGLKLDTPLLPNSLDATARPQRFALGTIPTTVGLEATYIVPYAGVLALAQFVAKDALAASDTNYITFSITNKAAGAGATAMLAATAANTTPVTGGTALAATVKRTLTLHGTPANLVVAAGDTLLISALVTGTLANTVTAPSVVLTITPS
jgi:hypothetical protein